jgi:formamidopyrimidine-DNA glycosylase
VPELPEVEVVRAGLAPAVTGARIAGVQILDPRSLKRHDGRRGDFVGLLDGVHIDSVERRGKFMWMPLSTGDALVVHLGMSGQVLLREPDAPADRHLRIRFDVESSAAGSGAGSAAGSGAGTKAKRGGQARELVVAFVDQRIFGSMAVDHVLEQHGSLVPSQVAHIALDPLDARFDDDLFVTRLRAKHTGLKRALLDQTLVSGVGNIYADEALWASRLHYDRATDSVTTDEARTILDEVRAVLLKALAEGGTSFDAQYVNVNGQAGYFAHSLNAYGRQGEACVRCGTPIVRESFMNRGSHFCPVCQPR